MHIGKIVSLQQDGLSATMKAWKGSAEDVPAGAAITAVIISPPSHTAPSAPPTITSPSLGNRNDGVRSLSFINRSVLPFHTSGVFARRCGSVQARTIPLFANDCRAEKFVKYISPASPHVFSVRTPTTGSSADCRERHGPALLCAADVFPEERYGRNPERRPIAPLKYGYRG